MTFDEYASKSINYLRVLVDIDIGSLNTQWVNAGSGIWYCDFNASYPEVGSPGDDLLLGFTAQQFGYIGSLTVDGIQYTKVSTLLEATSAQMSFWYNNVDKVYVHIINNDDPILHDIIFGVSYGVSYNTFTPVNSGTFYDERLISDIAIGSERDPLFWGKMVYSLGSISLVNNDGYFDLFAENNALWGNKVTIRIGFLGLDVSEYVTIFSSTIESATVSEDTFDIQLVDRRKNLSKSVAYTCTNKNALEAIRELLSTNYGATYDSTFYDTTDWASAEAVVPNITIDIASAHSVVSMPVIEIIEMICSSVFGMFIITPEGKYSFKIIDTALPASYEISEYDIINKHQITYNPSNTITSAKVGYARNWAEGYTEPYTYYINTVYEADGYLKYKTYLQKKYDTVLITATTATAFSEVIMAYSKDVHGLFNITVPIKYYYIEVGDIVRVNVVRDSGSMIGVKRCEVLSKNYNLKIGIIEIGLRIISGSATATFRIVTDGYDRVTTDGATRECGIM